MKTKFKEFEGIKFPVRPYFVLEGIVGVGKTTQSRLLFDYLQLEYPNRQLLLTHEPGSSEIADDIRHVVQIKPYTEPMYPVCEAYLYAASRAQTLPTLVQPVLDRGGIVQGDRSVFTSLSYQAFGRELGLRKVVDINRAAVGQLWPSRVYVLDVNMATALGRARDKLGDKFESMGEDFFTKAVEGYKYLADQYPDLVVEIDGNGSVTEVQQRLRTSVTNFLHEVLD